MNNWCWRTGALWSVILHFFAVSCLLLSVGSIYSFNANVSSLLEKNDNYKAIGTGVFDIERMCSDLEMRSYAKPYVRENESAALRDFRFMCSVYKINRNDTRKLAENLSHYFEVLVIIGIIQESFKYMRREWTSHADDMRKKTLGDPDHFYGHIGFVSLCVGLIGEILVKIYDATGKLDLFTLLSGGASKSAVVLPVLACCAVEIWLVTWSCMKPK